MMLGLAAALPFIPAAVQRLALVVSTAIIQLWMLPVLQVGTKIFSKSSEKRAIEDHRMLMEELAKIREMEALIAEILATQKRIEGLVSQRGAMQK